MEKQLTEEHLKIMFLVQEGATIFAQDKAKILREVQQYDKSLINIIDNMNELKEIVGNEKELYDNKDPKTGHHNRIEILKIERPQYEKIYKKGLTTHHVTIETDKLKELILENHSNYIDYTLKDKIKTIKRYAEFDNDTDLLKFLELMEE